LQGLIGFVLGLDLFKSICTDLLQDELAVAKFAAFSALSLFLVRRGQSLLIEVLVDKEEPCFLDARFTVCQRAELAVNHAFVVLKFSAAAVAL